MKVAVGIVGGELARYAIFYDSLMHVEGVTHQNVIQARGANVAENRNGIAERALSMGYDAIWHVDDDQVFAPDTLNRLIAHDKDIMSGLYLARQPPFIPQLYDQENARGDCHPRLLRANDRGVVKCLAVGAGCLLVKAEVYRKLDKPWWQLGQINKENLSDDLNFCHRVRQKGFDIWCDQSILVGHHMSGTLWPVYKNDGSWGTVLVYGKNVIAEWPPAQKNPAST